MSKQELQKELMDLLKLQKEYINNFRKSKEEANERLLNKVWDDFLKASDEKKKEIFFELISGQGSFLMPVDKHRQGKLFTKK
jgi:hypothetical protein